MGSARYAPTLPVEQRASTGQKAISSVTRKRKLLEPVRQSLPERAIACRAYLQSCLPVLQLTDGNSKTAAMSIEVIAAARRYLHELGAMWAPGWHLPLAGSTGPLAHAIHIASRAYWHGPARLRAVYGAAPALAAASGCLPARGLQLTASAFTAGRHWQTQRASRSPDILCSSRGP